MKLEDDEIGSALQHYSVANYLKHYRYIKEEQKLMTEEE
jgi:hypothetical protein